eukprot:1139236-Pelagomonas_calceolata.AAC.7
MLAKKPSFFTRLKDHGLQLTSLGYTQRPPQQSPGSSTSYILCPYHTHYGAAHRTVCGRGLHPSGPPNAITRVQHNMHSAPATLTRVQHIVQFEKDAAHHTEQ